MKSTTPSLPSALAVLGLTPAKIAEWRAQGFGRATHNAKTSIGKIERAGATAAIGDCVISNWVDITPAMAAAWLKTPWIAAVDWVTDADCPRIWPSSRPRASTIPPTSWETADRPWF